MAGRSRNPVGTHVPTGRGLAAQAYPTMVELGAETLQVFVGNPRGWRLSDGDPRQDERFRELCAEHETPVFVHTPYLVNLASPTRGTYAHSVAAVAHNLARGTAIGADGVVVHTGSCVHDGAVDAAMRQVREGLLPVLEALDDRAPWLLLEPTAGQGRSLCARVDDLGPYLDALDHHPRVGICLDTCHALAAGEPLDEPGGTAATLDRLVEIAGADRLRLVHANDSADPRGSGRDRHQRIGRGRLGIAAFAELLAHPATAGVPLVLETPGGQAAWAEDIATVQRLRESVVPAR